MSRLENFVTVTVGADSTIKSAGSPQTIQPVLPLSTCATVPPGHGQFYSHA